MKVLFTGGRFYNNARAVEGLLSVLDRAVTIMHGAAPGLDDLVNKAATKLGFSNIKAFPAKWDSLGRKAGPNRNQDMADELPDVCFVFPGTNGTEDMARRASKVRNCVVLRIQGNLDG